MKLAKEKHDDYQSNEKEYEYHLQKVNELEKSLTNEHNQSELNDMQQERIRLMKEKHDAKIENMNKTHAIEKNKAYNDNEALKNGI